jgi:predicted 3-demethylubiquinone-9 3-methyltransferase (glyoxalase superfamily)
VITDSNPIVTTFRIGNKTFMCLNGGPKFAFTPAISLFVYCKTVDETNILWDKLIPGGSVMMDINQYPWSERYGWLRDKFGLTWQISVVNPGESESIRPSMLFTKPVFGKAEEAMRFYTKTFKNSSITRLSHYSTGDANEGKVLYAEFQLNGYNAIAMDGPGNHAFMFNEAVSIVVPCENQEEIDFYWNTLSKGGEESMCGWLKDKYGVSWQIVPKILGDLMRDPKRSGRVVQAFLKMKKFNIQALLDA